MRDSHAFQFTAFGWLGVSLLKVKLTGLQLMPNFTLQLRFFCQMGWGDHFHSRHCLQRSIISCCHNWYASDCTSQNSSKTSFEPCHNQIKWQTLLQVWHPFPSYPDSGIQKNCHDSTDGIVFLCGFCMPTHLTSLHVRTATSIVTCVGHSRPENSLTILAWKGSTATYRVALLWYPTPGCHLPHQSRRTAHFLPPQKFEEWMILRWWCNRSKMEVQETMVSYQLSKGMKKGKDRHWYVLESNNVDFASKIASFRQPLERPASRSQKWQGRAPFHQACIFWRWYCGRVWHKFLKSWQDLAILPAAPAHCKIGGNVFTLPSWGCCGI